VVYFLQEDVSDGRIKIGYTSRTADMRLDDLQTANPRPLIVLSGH
jgi:hypothetical protein